MGTKPFRLFLLLPVLFHAVHADDDSVHLNANRQRITLSSLLTHSHYPSVQFALGQVNAQVLSQVNREFFFNGTEGMTKVRQREREKLS